MNVRTVSVFAWIFAACALPALDPNGAIVQGADGACPTGFEPRAGRCCPAGSSATACPTNTNTGSEAGTVTPGDDGMVTVTGDATVPPADVVSTTRVACSGASGMCPTGTSCLFGTCCPPGVHASGDVCAEHGLGGACTTMGQCRSEGTSNATCEQTSTTGPLPGGYCTSTCNANDPGGSCGMSGYCLSPSGSAVGVCVRKCNADAPVGVSCRPDQGAYRCLAIAASTVVCAPDCTVSGGSCATGYACDGTTHQCYKTCTLPTDCGGILARCVNGHCAR